MNAEEITTKIKEIIADVADLDIEAIGTDDHFLDDLDLDSLALLEIGVDVDYAFRLGAPDEELKRLRSVRESVALVERYLAAKELPQEAVA